MKQLLVLSGKGGTGKTTIVSALIELMEAKVFADCDVDAPNLHLLYNEFDKKIENDYYGLPVAKIDPLKCIDCGACFDNCKFDAINKDSGYSVIPHACEGCGVCKLVCPVDAVSLNENVTGYLNLFKTNEYVFSSATLKMGSGNSGKLVSEVKTQMNNNSADAFISIIDGSPGIGCPVIASLSGADIVLFVTEPSVSGLSDLKRVVETARVFNPIMLVCVNKYDINIKKTEEITSYCQSENIPVIGKIPYDKMLTKCINDNESFIDKDYLGSNAIIKMYQKLKEYIEEK
ncbi:MAG TPA: 4Fe-4S binding protein [Acholeplasmataceae bacterium]|nr:4Fe-4S binding protein [Acholeplasmataceae bacterium]